MTLVDELCAAAPTVIVLDDLQWADDASLIVWNQLAASIDQLRLLLIGACRPTPRRAEVRELRAAVVRRGGAVRLPASLAAVLTDRLNSVSADTAQMLRTGALLGGRFAVTDLAVVLRRPASELAAGVREAVAAGILIGSDPDLAFRHLLIQQALYESMPAALRTALHAEAARGTRGRGRGCIERRAAAFCREQAG